MKTVKFPHISTAVLGSIVALCLLVPLLTGDAVRMDFDALSKSPSGEHWFGTDQLGRDIFKMIWQGGRISIYIGVLASVVAAFVAMLYGAIAGLAGKGVDAFLMRTVELLLSIPSILYVVTLQAIFGSPGATSIAIVIGLTSWLSMSKIIRTEVLKLRRIEYVLSARQMGGKFLYTLKRHLFPGFMPAILFMLISNIAMAMATEATLSFIGVGLPVSEVSWGSLMSVSLDAFLTGHWWMIFIPGFFLVTTLVCVVNIGEYYRKTRG